MLKQFNDLIDRIEAQLTDDLALEELAAGVGMSSYHVSKVFFALCGMTLREYIRDRRLSEAGRALLDGASVTDIAYRYGYQSVDGFARAYKKWSGCLPSEVAKTGQGKVLPRITFTVSIQGGSSMEFRIVENPAFAFVGVSRRVPMQFEGVNQAIVELAQSITAAQRAELHRVQDIEPYEVVNVSYESDTAFLKEEGELTHMIGVLSTQEQVGEQLQRLPVPAATWAVFPSEGPFPFAMQSTMARIYSEWILSSSYELAALPTFSFTKMDSQKEGHAYCEIWVAVESIQE